MRHPTTLGAVVLGALVLALVALLHLVAARRTTGHRLLWAAVVLLVPVVGPLAYLLFGRMGGAMEEEEDVFVAPPPAAVRPAYVPPPPAPLPRVKPVALRVAPLPPFPNEPRSAPVPPPPARPGQDG